MSNPKSRSGFAVVCNSAMLTDRAGGQSSGRLLSAGDKNHLADQMTKPLADMVTYRQARVLAIGLAGLSGPRMCELYRMYINRAF